MIIWSGKGFLSIVVLITTLFLCVLIFPEESTDYAFVISFFLTAVFSWHFGKVWNEKHERIVKDVNTGQRLKINNNHTLFWLPIQYWGIIFSVLGIIILFQNSVTLGIFATSSLILLLIIPLINYKSKLAKKTESEFLGRNKESNSKELKVGLKKENFIKKPFEPSDHRRYMRK